MSCSICHQTFGEDRRPGVLNCRHIFCSPCLEHLHSMNSGVILCPQCGGEEYYANVNELLIVLNTEKRMTSLSVEEVQEEAVGGGDDVDGTESSRESCALHGRPLSSWCKACHHSVCLHCIQHHRKKQHKVVDYREARELLMSQYNHKNQAFLEWLVKVEAVTQETLRAAEAVVPPLKETLSVLQHHISKMKGQKQSLEDATSLETIEDLQYKSSRWCLRTQSTTQQQVGDTISILGRLESSVTELRRLQKEIEVGFARSGGDAASLPEEEKEEEGEEEEEEERQDVSPPRAATVEPRVVVQGYCDEVAPGTAYTYDLPLYLGTCYTTLLEIHAEDVRNDLAFALTYMSEVGCRLFWIGWYFYSNCVWMATYGPTTGRKEANVLLREQCGLQSYSTHSIRIVEDAALYTVHLDGVALGHIKKSRLCPPVATRIKMESYCTITDYRLLVKVEGLTVA